MSSLIATIQEIQDANREGEIMSDQEINIAIAEACGWTEVTDNRKFHQCPTGFPPNSEGTLAYVSDYCGDLNAMREAEKVLTEKQIRSYAFTLAQVLDTTPTVDLDDQFLNIHAPAQKRAEAFLRTIGKWKGEAK